MNKHEEQRRAEKIATMKRVKGLEEKLKKENVNLLKTPWIDREVLESWVEEEEKKDGARDQQIDNLTNIIAGLEVSTQVREQRIALRIAALRVDEEIEEESAVMLELAFNQVRALNRIAAALERG